MGEVFDPVVKKAHESWKETLAQKQKLEAPALDAERALKSMMAAWDAEQRRKVREAKEAATREAYRLADEAKLHAALEAETRGDDKGATKILEAPTPPAPIIVPAVVTPPPPKAEGISFKTTYRAEVTDLHALIVAVAAGTASITYLQANLTTLNQSARALKEEFKVPGIRVVAERSTAVRV